MELPPLSPGPSWQFTSIKMNEMFYFVLFSQLFSNCNVIWFWMTRGKTVIKAYGIFGWSCKRGSIAVCRLDGFGHIVDAKYGFSKQISAECGFSVATRLRKNGIYTNGLVVFRLLRGREWFVQYSSHCLLRCFYWINVIMYGGFA